MRAERALLIAFALAGCKTDFIFDPAEPEEVAPDEAPPDHGSWLSMDVAPNGTDLVMAYYDRTLGGLGFAVGTPNGDGTLTWAHEQVDGYFDASSGLDTGDRGKYASMAVAPDGTVWIAYYDAGKKDLRYAHRTGGRKSWVTGLIDNGAGGIPSAGEWASLALNSDGKPVIAYHDSGNKSLKVARFADTQDDAAEGYEWVVTEVQTGQAFVGTTTDADGNEVPLTREANVGTHARLLIAGATEYIAYYDAGQQRLGLLEGTGSGFTQSFVTPEGSNEGQWPSVLVEGGTVHIAYHDVGNQDLKLASRVAGGTYNIQAIDSGDFVGADTELIQRAGKLTVLYFDGQNNDMKLATQSGGVWTVDVLGSDTNAVGFHNEIVRLGDGFWAGSYDFTTRTVFTVHLPDPA